MSQFNKDTATRLAAELEECDAMATKGEWYVTEGDGNVYSKRDEASHPEDVGACDWDDSDIYAVTRLRNLAASAASQLRAAVGECEKVVHWKREASSAMVRAATAEQTAADLTTALAAAREEGERHKAVYEAAIALKPEHLAMPVNGDWACVQCKPHSDMLIVGFRCRQHALLNAIITALSPAAGEGE
jgi:hypothetical protein